MCQTLGKPSRCTGKFLQMFYCIYDAKNSARKGLTWGWWLRLPQDENHLRFVFIESRIKTNKFVNEIAIIFHLVSSVVEWWWHEMKQTEQKTITINFPVDNTLVVPSDFTLFCRFLLPWVRSEHTACCGAGQRIKVIVRWLHRRNGKWDFRVPLKNQLRRAQLDLAHKKVLTKYYDIRWYQ